MLRLWAERETLLAALDDLPLTLCHQDLYPPNLFARYDVHGRDQTVLIDWSYLGHGPLGQDIGNLVPDSVWIGYVPAAALRVLEQVVWNGYLAGLETEEWEGDPRSVR